MSLANGNLVIRADASTQIGTGHVMRCLALAQGWQDQGGHACFITAMEHPAIEARLKAEGMDVIPLSAKAGSREDAVETVNYARRMDVSWLVIDGYHFGAGYQRIVREAGLRLLVIDDDGHAEHYYADIVVNQNLHAHLDLYQNREPYTRLLLGTQYVLLRREFLRWSRWERKIRHAAQKVLVTLGGSDPNNATLKLIQALREMRESRLEVIVVVGGTNPHYAELQSCVRDSRFSIRVRSNVMKMSQLMAWADVAVSSASSTIWELAFMQLPAIIVVTSDNQWGVARSLSGKETFQILGWLKEVEEQHLAMELNIMLQNTSRRARMSSEVRQLVDGQGIARLVETIIA
jgi:UDP-2,4-diacetamido-2,4,6-trideoxy-beta-L-altropyranose hydrolase